MQQEHLKAEGEESRKPSGRSNKSHPEAMVYNSVRGDVQELQVEALGRPAVLVVPNAYHREDAAVWKVLGWLLSGRLYNGNLCMPFKRANAPAAA